MWIQEKFEEGQKLKRSGKLTSLTLPKGAKLKESAYKLNIKPKSLDFVKGNNAYIISDEIGISDEVSFSFFFLDDCMCVCVTEGLLYVRNTDGTIYSINHKNKMVKSDSKVDKIIWKSMTEMRDYTKYITQGRYNLVQMKDISEYENNLLYSAKSNFVPAQGNLFTIRFPEISEALGGSFKFVVYEKVNKEVKTDPKAFNDVDEDKYLYAEEDSYKVKRGKKPTKYSMSDDKEDMDDFDDVEDLTGSMHEINIFNDYTSLDEPV